VSRALTEKLRPQTLARVTEAVRRTGYTPNTAARTLRGRRTILVLVVVPDIANPFFSDVLRGIDEGLSQHGYGPIPTTPILPPNFRTGQPHPTPHTPGHSSGNQSL
jgi:LacI family repressor for deo operon, udp, cdd, tsx, nupC, and nupG